MLRAFYATKSDIPEALRDHYEGDDDKGWTLGVDDSTFKAKIAEFRGNNIELSQKRDSLTGQLADMKKKYGDVDLEQLAKMQEQLSKVEADEEKALLASGEFDEVFKRRTAAMIADHERQNSSYDEQIKGLTGDKDKLRAKLGRLVIDRSVQTALGKGGAKIRPGALDDIISRARGTWKLTDDGDMLPVDAEGQTLYGKDSKQLGMEEYAAGLVTAAPHLFEGAKGGGAGGGERPTPGGQIDLDDPLAFGDAAERIAKGNQ